jgi:hypothetical protein
MWLALAGASMLLMPGCEFIQKHEKAAIGVGAGAVGGAAVGGLAGGRKGAVYGGLLGALAGGAVGAYLDYKDKTAEETNAQYNYQAAQGVRLEVASASAEPQTVAPGAEVRLRTTYAVMAPDPQATLEVTEMRLVTLNGVKVVERADTVSRTPGTYTSELPITLPPGAAAGTYQMTVVVQTGTQVGTMAHAFTVTGS